MLFDTYKITKHIRLIELFAGIGSQAMALRAIGADFEHYRVVEFDKHAIKSYNAIHGTNFEPMDIRDIKGEDLGIVDTDTYTYILTYSFPCQDLSLAGKQQGMTKGSGTRSGLLWEVERLLNETENLPQILLMENVPQVHSKKNIADFNSWVEFLQSKGYSNFWQDLNAKDYGVAQSRKRCFMVSILGNAIYEFPKPVKLTKCIKDYLEDEVDEKYYIKSEKAYKLILDLWERGILDDKDRVTCDLTIASPREIDVMNCITARYDAGIVNQPCYGGGVIERVKQLGNFTESKRNNPNTNRVYDVKGISPALNTMQGGNRQPMIINNTLKDNMLMGYRVRKLTPCECWRLMGFSDEDFSKAAAVNSNTQLYKQAGNSIVKDVLMAIFRQMM